MGAGKGHVLGQTILLEIRVGPKLAEGGNPLATGAGFKVSWVVKWAKLWGSSTSALSIEALPGSSSRYFSSEEES
jgi:hypothetical protein